MSYASRIIYRVSSVCPSSFTLGGFYLERTSQANWTDVFLPPSNLYTSHYYKHLRSQTMIYCQKTIHETSCHLELKNTNKHVTGVPFVWEWLACKWNRSCSSDRAERRKLVCILRSVRFPWSMGCTNSVVWGRKSFEEVL